MSKPISYNIEFVMDVQVNTVTAVQMMLIIVVVYTIQTIKLFFARNGMLLVVEFYNCLSCLVVITGHVFITCT
jgi:hypothetical protein